MSNQHTDPLFQLIKTLGKSEKRNFKLYVNRNPSNDDAKFMQLFEVLDKMKIYEEVVFQKKMPLTIKRDQVSNLKAHLYRQLLTSLRLIHQHDTIDMQIREQLDFAELLYNRGLFLQSLKILERVKYIAEENNQSVLHLEILEFEKKIESRHITRSIEDRAEQLNDAINIVSRNINGTIVLSNFSLRLYGLYLKVGHVRDEQDLKMVKLFFQSNLPKVNIAALSFFEKIYLYQCHTWYNYIIQDFLMFYRYTQKWIDTFDQNESMKLNDAVLYMKGLHNLLTSLFMTLHYERFVEVLKDFDHFNEKNDSNFDEITRLWAFLYIYTAKINKHFLEGTFTEGLQLVPIIEDWLKIHTLKIDRHRELTFYYKIACLYFGSGDNGRAIDYLNKIINLKIGNLRTDIQAFARILHLVAHFELGHYELLEYLIKSVYRYISKLNDLSLIHQEILKFLRKSLYFHPKDVKPALILLQKRLKQILQNPYERRFFNYLDIISWLESKIQGEQVQEILKKKFLARGK
jgi:hypothetical protein